jgi:hypothetical protein
MTMHRHTQWTTHGEAAPFASVSARPRLRAIVLAATFAAGLLSGCSTLVGRPAPPLLAKRDEPGVILCMSERVSGGGIRLVGKLNTGIYPITRAVIEYRSADVSDAVPATPDERGKKLVLTSPRATKVNYRKGAGDVSFTLDGDDVRSLQGKVLWYRWLITYQRGGSEGVEVTDIHRTSLEEAGLPRDAYAPGPDSSVALPTARRR